MTLQFDRRRRLRENPIVRKMVQENHLRTEDLIYPIFVVEGENQKNEILSMPGQFQYSLDKLDEEMQNLVKLGIPSVILFGIPDKKDALGSEAYNDNGILQKAIRQIKTNFPELVVIADTCLCEYTDHGHCGQIEHDCVLNDESLDLLVKTAVSQAKAGADIIAPSNMMDGFVAAIRQGLDKNGFLETPIMSYAVKYSSAFYGPFRDAANSAPAFGDRKSYQMNPANRLEALREMESDIAEGADFLMVKPALSYLDIIRDVRENSILPLVTYNVSGEYSMLKAAAAAGYINERQIVTEQLLSMKRAGADLIITYFAKDVATWIMEENHV